MFKFWLKLFKNGKLYKDAVCDCDVTKEAKDILLDGLKNCCYELDIPNPIILKKHIADVENFNLTRFLPDDFPESVDFEKAEINIFDNSKINKRIDY